MMTKTVTLVAADAELAGSLRQTLRQAGFEVMDTIQPDGLLVAVVSPETQPAIVEALEKHQHVIPVVIGETQLPRMIDHLQPVNADDREALIEQVTYLASDVAPPPMVTHTPTVQAANRQAGMIMAVIALVIFAVGIYLVGFEGVQAPAEEFAGVETQIFLTRNWYIDEALPRSTEDAAGFEVTYEAARPSVQPFLGATATAIAEGAEASYIPRSTEQATAFPLTAQHVSTVVRERLIATVTAVAGE
jgi:hypothetical protein